MDKYLGNLQVLRAYAAANVVFIHLMHVFRVKARFGLYGVDLFFVLSGFLMAMIMTNDPTAFFRRRLIRIVPLYWLCTLGVYGIAILKPQVLLTTKPDLVNLVKSLCFVPYRKEGGVMQPMLFLGWTLNYEMYFYVLCSLVLLLRASRPILWVSMLVSVFPLLGFMWQPDSDLIGFYSYPIVWEFVMGMATYYAFCRFQAQSVPLGWEIWVLIACVVALPCMESAHGVDHRQILLGLPAAGALLAAACLERKGVAVRNRLILLVGNASYILYLTHPYVFQAGDRFLHCGQWSSVGGRMAAGVLLAGLAVAFACALHVLVEVPLMRKLKLLFLPPKVPRVLPGKHNAVVVTL